MSDDKLFEGFLTLICAGGIVFTLISWVVVLFVAWVWRHWHILGYLMAAAVVAAVVAIVWWIVRFWRREVWEDAHTMNTKEVLQ